MILIQSSWKHNSKKYKELGILIYKIHTKKEITTSEAMTARLLQALALSRLWMEFAATLFSNSR